MKTPLRSACAVLLLAVLAASPARSAPLDDAAVAYDAGDYAKAAALFRAAADKGDAEAQNRLGSMYMAGQGVASDYAQAVAWYRKAAESGYAKAQANLGTLHLEGLGVARDYSAALSWYRKAAAQGLAYAQDRLGYMHLKGLGVPKDDAEAARWFEAAAAQGNPNALRRARVLSEAPAAQTPPPVPAPEAPASPVEPPSAPAQAQAPVPAAEGMPSAAAPPALPEPAWREQTPAPSFIALIIGIEGYADLPAARFADRDAEAMGQILARMGYPMENIVTLRGPAATRQAIAERVERWLPKVARPDSTVFVYFSGLGAPNLEDRLPYLVPWDGDDSFVGTTGYPLHRLYAVLEKLKVKHVIVALDTSFSGGEGRSVLAAGWPPVRTPVLPQGTHPGFDVFAATAEDGDAAVLEERGHGLFTYYLLRGLAGPAQNFSGTVTAGGLFNYLRPLVEAEARLQNARQTPLFFGRTDRAILSVK